MEKLLDFLRYLISKFLEEKFRAFRTGFFAGGAISLPFLFSVHGISLDLMWIFPLKLFMSVCFAYCTGLASHGAKTTWSFIIKRLNNKKNNSKKSNKNNSNGRAA